MYMIHVLSTSTTSYVLIEYRSDEDPRIIFIDAEKMRLRIPSSNKIFILEKVENTVESMKTKNRNKM